MSHPEAQLGLCFDDPSAGWTCGVDEAGRGPLAGPVFAAAVILPPEHAIIGLADSKVLSAKKREHLFSVIQNQAVAWCIAQASVAEIDALNILHASMLAMKRAVEGLQTPLGLPVTPTLALIDGNRCPPMAVRSEAIVKGDAKVPAISAASILAKVARDRCLRELHMIYPQYGFDKHSGYPTAAHMAALLKHGATPHHRRSFGPVRRALENAVATNAASLR